MPLARLVVVEEAGAAQPARPAELDHPVDHGLARVGGVGAAGGLDRVRVSLRILSEQLHVQLVGQLQRADRVAGLGGGLLDGGRRHALGRASPAPR